MSAYQKITSEYTSEEKQLYWNIGTDLQAVDGLRPSDYLMEQRDREIAGEISPEYKYINMFFENVLYGKNHKLESEDLIIAE